jgi:hypothetical protein
MATCSVSAEITLKHVTVNADQVEDFAGRGLDFWRVDETVATDPEAVIPRGEVGHQVSSLSSVTVILANLVGRSDVSAITHTPAGGRWRW